MTSHSKKEENKDIDLPEPATLKRGWTTGANAAAAALLGLQATHRGIKHVDNSSVSIDLPHQTGVVFQPQDVQEKNGRIIASFKKDAGDDPDITHGLIIRAEVIPLPQKNNDKKNHDAPSLELLGGTGVGRVTRLGLPIAVGLPAITPKPRDYISKNFYHYLQQHPDLPQDWQVIFHLENGVELAKKTLNPRLGIVDGLSILGTSGVVIPYSCAAWIHSIHRSIDVALAYQQNHLLAATGSTSEAVAKEKYCFDELAIIDMGDFYVATMKYLHKKNYQGQLTIAGGPGKLCKLAQGHGDLHHERSRVDMMLLAAWVGQDSTIRTLASGAEIKTMGEVLTKAASIAEGLAMVKNISPKMVAPICQLILEQCQQQTQRAFPHIKTNFMMVDRGANIMASLSSTTS